MAGNSKRKGAIKKTGKGNPTAGSGGRVRRGLEGRGPTPKAKDRPYHQAHKAAKRAEKERATRTKRRTTSDAEWAAGRNSVVELLQAGVPVAAVYVAEGAERDGRSERNLRRCPVEHFGGDAIGEGHDRAYRKIESAEKHRQALQVFEAAKVMVSVLQPVHPIGVILEPGEN